MKRIFCFLVVFFVAMVFSCERKNTPEIEKVNEHDADSFFMGRCDEFGEIAYFSPHEIYCLLSGFDDDDDTVEGNLMENRLITHGFYIIRLDPSEMKIKGSLTGTTVTPCYFSKEKMTNLLFISPSIEYNENSYYMCWLDTIQKGLKGGRMAKFHLIKTIDEKEVKENKSSLFDSLLYIKRFVVKNKFDLTDPFETSKSLVHPSRGGMY